jgi:serine/threonine-protein kinase
MLDDKYRIEHLLAVGGMGAVYLGTHIKLRKRVAIKVLNPEISTPPMVERFHREAITASQIGHEGIAQVTDIGTSQQGEPFLVMEYLEGESLAARLRASGPLPIEVACELACAILSPLAAAHGASIVHRDLKPDNVFLVRQSRGEMVKLLDFGISRAAGLENEFRLTTTGLVLGTPYYMSPEQARGDSYLTAACDLYALGVILYEMLVGSVPIQGENYNQLMYRVMSGEFVRPRQHRPDLPPALEDLIAQTMALDPRARPASAAELEQALLAFCRPTFREHTIERISATSMQRSKTPSTMPTQFGTDRTLLVTPPGSTPVPAQSPAVAAPPALVPAPAPARNKNASKTLWILLVLGLVAGLATAAIVMMNKGSKPENDPEPVAAVEPAIEPTIEPPVVTTPATPATAPVPPATVTLRFAIEPATAKITVDGKPITSTELVVPKDATTHTVKITAAGHTSHAEELRFDESQRIMIQLKPTKSGGTRPTRPSKPDRPTKPDRIDSTSPYQ